MKDKCRSHWEYTQALCSFPLLGAGHCSGSLIHIVPMALTETDSKLYAGASRSQMMVCATSTVFAINCVPKIRGRRY